MINSSLIGEGLVSNMVEIKISVSEKMEKLLQKISDDLGIKKTEFIKNLIIENLKKRLGDKK